jgi:hypothetical protein
MPATLERERSADLLPPDAPPAPSPSGPTIFDTGPAPAPPTPAPGRRRRWVVAALVMLLLAGLVVVASATTTSDAVTKSPPSSGAVKLDKVERPAEPARLGGEVTTPAAAKKCPLRPTLLVPCAASTR